MSSVVNQAQIPSTSSGELYQLVEYDDGTITCSCPYGSRRGPMGINDRVCKHVRSYRLSGDTAYSNPLPLPPAHSPQELGLRVDRWMGRFAGVFCPVDYMLTITQAVIQEDNVQRQKSARKSQGETRLRPQPLPDAVRSILQALQDTLSGMKELQGTAPSVFPADILAHDYMLRALNERHQPDPNTSNTAIARRLHRGLVGDGGEDEKGEYGKDTPTDDCN